MDEMINTYDSAQGEGCYPVLALLDEICRTGMPNLPEYATTVCGRNISLVIPVQSLHQLDASFGKYRAEILRAQMESQIFYRPADQETAEYLEKALGSQSGFAHSKTEHEGSISHGSAEQRIPLMTAQEIKLLSDEDIIGFRSGLRPFRAKRMNWQRFPLLRQRQTIPPPKVPLLPQLEGNLPDQARPEPLPLASWRTDSNLYRKWRPLHTMNRFKDRL
jgi:type IV secretory pathway TraG/TraD family ATPase VirD4